MTPDQTPPEETPVRIITAARLEWLSADPAPNAHGQEFHRRDPR